MLKVERISTNSICPPCPPFQFLPKRNFCQICLEKCLKTHIFAEPNLKIATSKVLEKFNTIFNLHDVNFLEFCGPGLRMHTRAAVFALEHMMSKLHSKLHKFISELLLLPHKCRIHLLGYLNT